MQYNCVHRYVFDVVRALVPKIDLDDVFTAKEEIAKDVQAALATVRCVMLDVRHALCTFDDCTL